MNPSDQIPSESLEQLMTEASDCFDEGNLSKAEALCRKVLERKPDHPTALALLGSIALTAHQPALAVELLTAASQRCASDDAGGIYYDLALAFQASGNAARAIICFQHAAELEADSPDAWHALAVCLQHAGRFSEAVDAFSRTVSLDPERAADFRELARCLQRLERYEPALENIDRAMTLDAAEQLNASTPADEAASDLSTASAHSAPPRMAQIASRPQRFTDHLLRALILEGLHRLPEAVEEYRRSIALGSNSWHCFNNLASVLRQLDRFSEAGEYFRKAIELDPQNPLPCINFGHMLARDLCRFDEGAACFEQAIERASRKTGIATVEQAIAHFDALPGASSAASQRISAAAASSRGNLAAPDSGAAPVMTPPTPERMLADARANLGMMQLVRGDFRQGWGNYRWRLAREDFSDVRRFLSHAQWDGSPLQGRTIVVYAEQGMGDVIQFCRYVPLVVERGGRVVVVCQHELRQLLLSLEGINEVLDWDQFAGRQPSEFQAAVPLLELPAIFETTLENILATVPYLTAPAEKSRLWGQRLRSGEGADNLHVGLAWAGRATHGNDARRSLRLADFAALAAPMLRGVTFISLQKGVRAEEAQAPLEGMKLLDFESELSDFSDTAALVSELDLVIGVDTAVAHLAGALAKPVWTLLAHSPDWRWLLDRTDSPWYPTMRLYRQGPAANWPPVIERVARDLSQIRIAR